MNIHKYQKISISIIISFFLLLLFLLSASQTNASGLSRPPNNLGLVGYWSLDDNRGTKATDFSGNGNTGTLTGANGLPVWTKGNRGQALSFDGIDDYVSASAISGLTSTQTKTFWVKFPTFSANGNMYFVDEGGNNNWVQIYDGAGSGGTPGNALPAVRAGISAAGFTDSVSELSPNQWYFIAITSVGTTTIDIYINGVLDKHGTVSASNTPSTINIGRYGGNGQYFSGIIDEVRIYNRALSANQVKALYQLGAARINSSQNKFLTGGLVGEWSLDGVDLNRTTAFDRSGQGNNGTRTGTTATIGKVGQALSFNGTSDYVNLGTGSSLNINNNLTIATWFKVANGAPVTGMALVAWGEDSNGKRRSIVLYNNGSGPNKVLFSGYGAAANLVGTSSVDDGNWHHAVVTLDGSNNAKVYVDGRQENSGAVTLSAYTFSGTYLGSSQLVGDALPEYFKGTMDETRIYNRVLSATEVKSLYQSGAAHANASQNTVMTSGLVGEWSFNGADLNRTTAFDRSGQGNNGTRTGTTATIGKVGQALSFNGTSDYVDISSLNYTIGTGDFTAVSWVRTSNNTTQVALGTTPTGGNNFWLGKSSGVASFSVNGTTTGSNSIADGNWHFLVGVRSGGTIYCYLDGILVGTPQSSAGAITSQGYAIGRFGTSGSFFFNGTIDEVRIYNRALSATEVYQLYKYGR